MSRLVGWFIRLKRGLIWIGKAALLSVFAGLLTWGGLQFWQIWQGHEQGQLIEVKLVNESERVSQAELAEMLKPHLGLGFWQLDLSSIRKQVESHPWVAQAEVSRFWPNTLMINIAEQVPVARWGESAFLNQVGEIFEPKIALNSSEQFDLIRLSAVNPQPKAVLVMLKDLLNLINPYGLHIKAIHRLADESWHVWLINGDEWLLPKQEALADLKQLLALYGNIPKQVGTKMRIDLRYRDGFAVKWQPLENFAPSESQP